MPAVQPETALRFADAGAIFAAAAALARPPEQISVSDCALRHRHLKNPGGGISGPWTFEFAPYLRQPMDDLGDPLCSLVGVMGPVQVGKSEIPNCWLAHTALYDPADILWLQADKTMMRDYSVRRIEPLIELTRGMAALQRPEQGADNIFEKRFRGFSVTFIWPSAAQLTARAIPRVVADDYDNIPDDIDGQGDALTLLEGRQTTFEGSEKTFVGGSPAKGRAKGIESVVARGTDCRWHWACPDCGHRFPPAFADLDFRKDGTAEDAAASVHLRCPDCGTLIPPSAKQAMNAGGVWVPRGMAVDADGALVGPVPASRVRTYRIHGLMGFASWARLAEQYRTAELAWERTADEEELRAFYNTRLGENYESRDAATSPLTVDVLESHRGRHTLGTVPAWALCLTAAVDVQANRFECQVTAWGEGLRSAIVDRFEIAGTADGRAVNPAKHAAHWGVLLDRVIWRRYPVFGQPEVELAILNTAIDTGGIDGVTDNAFAFWHTARKVNVPETSLTLVKGGNSPKAPLLPAPSADAKRRKGQETPPLFVPNVNRFKTMLDRRLRVEERGPLHVELPADLAPHHAAELVAERRDGLVWVNDGKARNETLDLTVYNMVALTRHGGHDGSLAWLPRLAPWALPRRAKPGKAAAPAVAAAIAAPPANGVRSAAGKPRYRVRNRRG